MNLVLDKIRKLVRFFVNKFARLLYKLFGNLISPNLVTTVGLIAHIPIAILIAKGNFIPAASLLIVFGLFDALDGELARLQNKASASGMLLDASTDRIKEILLYLGISYYFIHINKPSFIIWIVGALGGSLLVSYVKAKGETAIASTKLSHSETNRIFQDGLMRFEVRMFLIVLGLYINRLEVVIIIIAVLSWLTAIYRLMLIMKKIN